MHLLSRLPGVGFAALVAGSLLIASCETTRTRERSDPTREAQRLSTGAAAELGTAASRQVAQVMEAGPPTFKTAESVLAAAFIRQFGDGTVIDKILVRQAPGPPKSNNTYYLIGMGLNEGKFRAMALPLRNSGNGALYLTPNAERYVLTGNGCSTCVFNFEGDQIVGSACADNSEGAGTCTFKVLDENTLFVRK